MAASGFKEHSQTGIAYAAIVFGTIALTSKFFTLAAIIAFVGFIGSVIPDVDSYRSRPRKSMLYFLVFVGTAIGYVSSGLMQFQKDYLPFIAEPNPFYSAIMGFSLGYIFQLIADHLLVHRGVTHSISGSIMLGMIIAALISFVVQMPNEWMIVTFLAAAGGVFIHMFTDWAYGVMSARNNNHLLFTLGGNLKENIFLLIVTTILVLLSHTGKLFYDFFLQAVTNSDVWIFLAVINFVLFGIFLFWAVAKDVKLGRGIVNLFWFIGCGVMAVVVKLVMTSY